MLSTESPTRSTTSSADKSGYPFGKSRRQSPPPAARAVAAVADFVRQYRFAYLMIVPAFVAIGVIALYPAAYSVWTGSHRISMILPGSEWVGLQNYERLLDDDRFRNAWFNTLYFTFMTVFLETVIGMGIALVLNEKFPLRGFVRAAVLVPWAIPTVVSSRLWGLIFSTDSGIANYALREVGIIDSYRNWLGEVGAAMNVVVLVDVWKTTPFMALLVLAGLGTIDDDLYEAAKIDGASMLQRFVQITLPMVAPVALIAIMIRALDAFRVFDVVYVLTGGGPADSTETMSTLTYKILFSATQFGYGSAMATVMFVTLLVMAIAFLFTLRNRMEVS
jgi:ABC-type sugar transport system permease subunit